MGSATTAAAVLLPSSCGSIYWDAVTLAASTPGAHPAGFTKNCSDCLHVQLQLVLLSTHGGGHVYAGVCQCCRPADQLAEAAYLHPVNMAQMLLILLRSSRFDSVAVCQKHVCS